MLSPSTRIEATKRAQHDALYSTVHGGGGGHGAVLLPRASGSGKTGKVIQPGAITRQMMNEWVREKVVVRARPRHAIKA